MNPKLHPAQVFVIRKNLEKRPTDELAEIYRKRDSSEWSPEAFEAIRQILYEKDCDPGISKEDAIALTRERVPVDADHSGVSSFQGIGTTHYGMRDIRRDGSYLTTEWMIFFYIPLIPLASRRIIVGSSKSQHRVFFLTHKKSYRVIERLRRPDLVQVLSVYSFTLFYIAWIVAGCVWWNVADADRFSGTLKMAMIIFSPWAIPYAHAKWEIHKASGKLV